MPLSNVLRRQANGEWVRTTVDEADKLFPCSVPVSEKRFRCNICYQYVTFRKAQHGFWHSRGETNKDCEDRIKSASNRAPLVHEILPLPLKLLEQDDAIDCYVGFPPVPELQTLEEQNFTVRLSSGPRSAHYLVDRSRFSEHETSWISFPISWLFSLVVTYSSESLRPIRWSKRVSIESRYGLLFDGITGYQIMENGDVLPNHDYILVQSKELSWLDPPDISIERLNSRILYIYRIRATAYSDAASNFFFMKLRMRLTNVPTDLVLAWPPALVHDRVIETNCRCLWMTIKGDADLNTIPEGFIRRVNTISEEEKNIELCHDGSLSVISAGGDSGDLVHFFVDNFIPKNSSSPPDLRISDREGKDITNVKEDGLPVNGIIRISSDVDGYVEVNNTTGFLYRKEISACEETWLTDLTYGCALVIRQGLDIVRTITFEKPSVQKADSFPVKWKERLVPFPKRYAGVLTLLPKNTPLYHRTLSALHQGLIPLDGLNQLRNILEGKRHE